MLKLIGKGATAEIYLDGNIASKVYLNRTIDEVENERFHQQFAHDSGLAVPQVYDLKQLEDGRVVLEMAYIEGKPLMHEEMEESQLVEAMKVLVRLQDDMHQIHATELPKLVDVMGKKILSTPLDVKVKNALMALLSQLDNQAEQLCHGDFHPLNVLFDGEKYWIIDWVDATAGNPLADLCRTYLLLKSQMTELAVLYLQVLCAEIKCQADAILNWQPVVAAARLSENIDDSSRDDLENLVTIWYEERF